MNKSAFFGSANKLGLTKTEAVTSELHDLKLLHGIKKISNHLFFNWFETT